MPDPFHKKVNHRIENYNVRDEFFFFRLKYRGHGLLCQENNDSFPFFIHALQGPGGFWSAMENGT